MNIQARTHVGTRRAHNEDRHLVQSLADGTHLLAVCDGMGGARSGDVAATLAIDRLATLGPDPWPDATVLTEMLHTMHQAILAEGRTHSEQEGMGSTATVAALWETTVHWAHVGDSRLYRVRDGRMHCMTHDHTVPGLLLKKGDISPEEARHHPMRNTLLNHLGCAEALQPEQGSFECHHDDLLLLCSDGLHGEVAEETLLAVLARFDTLPEQMDGLIAAALEGGGSDNITVLGATF